MAVLAVIALDKQQYINLKESMTSQQLYILARDGVLGWQK